VGAAPLQPANALGGPTALQGALPAQLQQLLASQIAQVRLLRDISGFEVLRCGRGVTCSLRDAMTYEQGAWSCLLACPGTG
jgi:hypothetical protein